eukprot:TRINITY_DN7370_c1_g1_i2.p1 TRINITY_DN7370_c1_g1~~TRINITY_DN7370_c1_g1_i2.p1  ORF type:complete len:156 (+),score=33.58 TRINITY_DN7370_c1_g1_i2:125-592(+)
MSSIQAAIFNDCQKGRLRVGEGNRNFVALTSSQEANGHDTVDDFHEQMRVRREAVREQRKAEGGRAGGWNERQDVGGGRRQQSAEADDEGGIDEFGRVRKGSKASAGAESKADRAKAALERLRQRAAGSTKKQDERQGSSRHGRHSRSRSRSRRR